MTALRILTFNWHEAYLCLLAKTGHNFTVVDKFKGGHSGWLGGTRPVPGNFRLLPVGADDEALGMARAGAFDLAICHNLADLAAVSGIRIPKIVVFHNKLSTEIALFKAAGRPAPAHSAQYAGQFRSLFDALTQAVFISQAKRADAGEIDGRVILPGIDPGEYGGYRGELPRVLRVGNGFTGRDLMLGQAAAAACLRDLPVTVLGINPEIPGSRLSSSWDDLKEQMRSHRVYLNTTVDGYEDGYNLAMLEAMATGMPVVSLPNCTSPLEDGVSGFVSDEADRLHDCLSLLLGDRALAGRMGARARETVEARFPIDRFVQAWNETLGEAVHRSGSMLQSGAAAPGTAETEARARALLAEGAWSRARELLEDKLKDSPKAAPLWKVLGFAYRNLGREPEAYRSFWAAARLDPADQEAQMLLRLVLASIAPGAHPENNPEAAVLACICAGKGIDVGCGPNKTHPEAIGVDLVPAGSPGTAGGVKGLASVADVCASGDNLHMFRDGELDYVVSRHNLEHYQDPLKALEEWKRVLKPGGILGLVLPDDTDIDSIHLDETHKHVFTPDSFRRLIRYLGDFDIVYLGTCLEHWSFLAVLQKSGGSGEALDYKRAFSRTAAERCGVEALRREENGEPASALECWLEASALQPENPEHQRGRFRMLRRLGRLEEARGIALVRGAALQPGPSCEDSASRGRDSRVPRETAGARKRILLSFCANPMTTGVYLERALRSKHEVLTWGPCITEDVLKAWDLEAIRDRVHPTDLGYDGPNPAETLKRRAPGWIPDLFLWVESGVRYPMEGLAALPCLKACYLIDTHLEYPEGRRVDAHLEFARSFDAVFLAQRAYVQRFREAGLNAYWLPLACDPDVHRDMGLPRPYPIGFVGSLNHKRRIELVERLRSRFPVHVQRCFLDEMSRVFSQSRIVFNNAVNNDLNMRVFEAMASGALLLTDPAPGSGLEELFQDGRHLAVYRDDESLPDAAERWLSNETAREKTARAGQAEVLSRHTYANRMAFLEQVLFPSTTPELKSSPAPAGDVRSGARALMTIRRNGSGRGAEQSEAAVEAKLARGRILLSSGKYDEAEAHLRGWQQHDPASAPALLGLGCVHLARGRWDAAESEFRAALRISPDEPKALCGLGLALANDGRETEATDALVRGFRQEPSHIAVLHTLIRAALAVGRYDEALQALESCMRHERPRPELLFSCAVLSAKAGRKKEALSLLDRIEQLQPAYPGIASYRAEWSR